jgi:hypothetical protein
VFWDVTFGPRTALENALIRGFPATAVDDDNNTLLHIVVCRMKMASSVPGMLASGWDPNAKNRWGRTPVHNACRSGALDILQELVEAGGSLAIAAHDGCTPAFDAYSLCLVEWLQTRPEVDWCRVNHAGLSLGDIWDAKIAKEPVWTPDKRCRQIVAGAAAAQLAQRRWSPLRVAFVGAVVAGMRVCE